MLTLKLIQEKRDEVIALLKVKNFDGSEIIGQIIVFDDDRKLTQKLADDKKAEMNKISAEIGTLMKSGKTEEANAAKQKTADLKEEIRNLSLKLSEIEKQVYELLVQVPNLPHSSVHPGKSSEDNQVVRSGGNAENFSNAVLPHWDLAKKFRLIDFDLGNKITGSGFPVFMGKGAKLQRALVSFFLDEAEKSGFSEYLPPYLVNEDSAFGTGQLPDKEGQMYKLSDENLFLIPTAEVPVTNIFRDMILEPDQLPVKCVAFTPCFRREAGSYGKDVRGLNRVHQFDKVEIVRIEKPENSYTALEEMVSYVESLVQKLGLPYRIVRLCGGDISFTSALTYDFEVYAAAQKKWLEVSSVSNFESFQSNRLKLRYRDENKKIQLAHTLNGSALALPRIVAALLENNQGKDEIIIPGTLVKYTGFDSIKPE